MHGVRVPAQQAGSSKVSYNLSGWDGPLVGDGRVVQSCMLYVGVQNIGVQKKLWKSFSWSSHPTLSRENVGWLNTGLFKTCVEHLSSVLKLYELCERAVWNIASRRHRAALAAVHPCLCFPPWSHLTFMVAKCTQANFHPFLPDFTSCQWWYLTLMGWERAPGNFYQLRSRSGRARAGPDEKRS